MYNDRQHVANKIDWEGGIWGWLNYGADPDDMPDKETEEALTLLLGHFSITKFYAGRFRELLPDGEAE